MQETNDQTKEIPYGKNILIGCPNCGFKGEPAKYRKGNIFLEIILWFLLIIPGVIYTALRHINTFCCCPKCKQHYLLETDGDNNLIDMLCKIRRKQLCWFWIIVLGFSILGIISITQLFKATNQTNYQKTTTEISNTYNNYNQNNDIFVEPQKVEEIKNEENKINLPEIKDEFKEEVKNEEPKDPNDEVREKMKGILAEIDRQYGNIDSYVGAKCYGDCINGIIKIKFRENIDWYDFTVKAHSADWNNKIIREIPGVFEKIQIDFICGKQTISSCIFTEYQMNSYTPKGCTYYGYSD